MKKYIWTRELPNQEEYYWMCPAGYENNPRMHEIVEISLVDDKPWVVSHRTSGFLKHFRHYSFAGPIHRAKENGE